MDKKYMRRAIELAAKGEGHVNPNPLVGAVIVKDGRILAEGYHARYGDLHAERSAFANLKEDATGAEMYVTLEPCPMCAGAIINSRIEKVTFGAYDEKNGAAGSKINLFEVPFTFRTEYEGGVMEEACRRILSDFFLKLREKRKEEKQ